VQTLSLPIAREHSTPTGFAKKIQLSQLISLEIEAEKPLCWVTQSDYSSVGALTGYDHPGCLEQNLEVKPQGPFERVLEIQPNHLIKRGTASAFYLP
jgi:hypothetical protein